MPLTTSPIFSMAWSTAPSSRALLRRHGGDSSWADDLPELRRLLEVDERLLLDTTFLINHQRSGVSLDDAFGDHDDIAIGGRQLG